MCEQLEAERDELDDSETEPSETDQEEPADDEGTHESDEEEWELPAPSLIGALEQLLSNSSLHPALFEAKDRVGLAL